MLTEDPVYVAMTRPTMRWGVTFTALILEVVVTALAFIVSHQPLLVLVVFPLHAVCWWICYTDARMFEVLMQGFRLTGRHRNRRRDRCYRFVALPLSRRPLRRLFTRDA